METLIYSVWAALLTFFKEGQGWKIPAPLQKRLAPCQTKKLSVSESHLISGSPTLNKICLEMLFGIEMAVLQKTPASNRLFYIDVTYAELKKWNFDCQAIESTL